MPTPTLERRAFVDGLFDELVEQTARYQEFTHEWLTMQGRMEMCEKAVRATRDHLLTSLEQTDEEVPLDWRKTLDTVRFVGARPADACLTVLRERGNVTTDGLIKELNRGGYRFNSPYPQREIQASMMRHPHVTRVGDLWTYEPPQPKVVRPRRERGERETTEAKAS